MTNREAIKIINEQILDMDYPNGIYRIEPFSEKDSAKHHALYKAIDALRAQQEPNEPLLLGELKKMEIGQWVWIEVLQPFDCKDKVSAYYKKSYDYTGGEAICCGYPGLVFSFDYSDYGKTWLAYRRKREQEG